MTPLSGWLWFPTVFVLAGVVAADAVSKTVRRRLIVGIATIVTGDFLVFILPLVVAPNFSSTTPIADLAMRGSLLLGPPVLLWYFTRVALRALARRTSRSTRSADSG